MTVPEDEALSEEIFPNAALADIFSIAAAISAADDLPSLLDLIVSKARELTCSDAGAIYLREGNEGGLCLRVFQNSSLQSQAHPLLGKPLQISPRMLVGWTVQSGEVLNIGDVHAISPDAPYQFDDAVDRKLGYRSVSMLVVPLRTSSGEVVGTMQLINRKHNAAVRITVENSTARVRPYNAAEQALIQALAHLAAVCVQRTRLLEHQRRQIDSMVAMLAGAIDARSPHTGSHCERVPELAILLAQAAEAEQDGPLAGFRFHDEQEWREFRTAAWLHDCGKIATPDCLVEKATKLDAWGNRISEIRTRFEVLLRDARIEMLEAQLAGGDPEQLERNYRARAAELHDDFAFIARCNLGSERMEPNDRERLRELAGRRWQRHFDDRLGLGWEERSRFPEPPPALPAMETLLADHPWHRIPRPPKAIPDPSWGFKMAIPAHLYNRGELYNLSIPRGTLTAEERYLIQEHMVHTIMMLEGMHFPPEMARVPAYAGAHHETLTGNGYPRGLKADQLPIPARILAIADIFEALTASDRPYKRCHTVSEALSILEDFHRRGTIDGDLLDVFIRSGVWRTYGQRFLRPDQLDITEFPRPAFR